MHVTALTLNANPRVAEPVPLGSLGGQSLPPREFGSFIGGFRALPGGASFTHKTVIFILVGRAA